MKSKLMSLALTLALAGAARADFNPVPLTAGSFNFDVVLSSNAVKLPPYCITATSGGGTSKGDYTYFEQGYYARPGITSSNLGIPVHNTIFTDIHNANTKFLMPPSYLTNNDLQVDSTHTTGTFTIVTPTNVIGLAILSGGAGSGTVTYSVNHQSGSPETGTLNLSDWFTPNGAEIAWGANSRVSQNNGFDTRSTGTANTVNPYLYSYYITGVSSNSPVTSIDITWGAVNEGNFYAVSGSPDETNYTPIPVSGFNQMTTVPAPIPYPVNATMDNGTNLAAGGNTWFEQGYYPPTVSDGLPPSGSIFNSSTQPTHHYQMGNYTTNCGVLIDANHRSNNIVPLNPQPYTAFAFLTAGGNVGTGKKMTNICILQHQGGVNETNIFIGYDWFESTVPSAVAYVANGRFSLNYNNPRSGGYNTLGGGNPKLFETYFTLSDTADTVTNIIVLYGTAPGANSTTFIMAVSATAGGLPPLVSAGPTPATQTWFAGQTATFNVSVSGTAPITNIWEVETNGVYVPLTDGLDANGSYIFGSATTTLTISNLSIADGTNYQYVATNIVGGATAGPASLVVMDDSLATPVTIVSQVPPSTISTLSVFTNLPTEFNVTVNNTASPPVSYQWYSGVPQTPANAIPGATNAGYTFSNQVGVTLSCIASNIGGTATSSPVTISATPKSPLVSPAAYQAALIGYNPVAYWPLDETNGTIANDLVGNNNGTYVGNCVLGLPGVTGALNVGTNFSVSFDGSTAYVDVPVNNLNIKGPMTAVQWVKTTGESSGTDFNDAFFATTLSHGNNGFRLDVDGSGDPHFADPAPDATGTTSVADNKWHQMVGVYDGTNEYVYVDGSLAAQAGVPAAPPGNSTTDVWIGGDPDYGTQATLPNLDRLYFGNICQVAILTNALSASQVAGLYAAAGLTPVIATDLQPTYFVYAGFPLVLSVTATGNPPLSYQWQYNSGNLSNGGRISGARSNVLTIANCQTNDGGAYQLIVTNAQGSTSSVATAVTVVPVLGFNGNGQGWSLNANLAANGYQGTNNTLQLTSNSGGEATSSFFDFPVYVGGFTATFNYQDVTQNGADGIAFVVQNDSRGTAAVGAGGGSLGFAGGPGIGIAPSVGAELNIYANQTVGYNFQTNPVAPVTPFLTTSPVDPSQGDIINVTVTYLAGTMTMTLVDSVAATSFTASYAVDIPTLLGTNLAYVGFTGADGGLFATQQVSNFQYIPIVSLTATPSGGNSLVFTWPTGIGAYVLEQTSSLSSPNWAPATAAYTTVGGLNQATITTSGAGYFYRLHLSY